jgi:YHS domain-containing protein
VALGGYCPVELVRNGRWTPGDVRWTVVHKGWIYRLSGPEQRQQFLSNPDAFVPVNSGNDPVLSVDRELTAPGQPTYCATYRGRLYMFSSAATQEQFNRSPQRYAAEK